MQRAANAHDTDAFMAPFLHQPSLVFVIDGETIRGWDALHAQQLKWWRNGKSDAVYTPSGNAEFMPLAADLMLTTTTHASRRTLANGKASNGTSSSPTSGKNFRETGGSYTGTSPGRVSTALAAHRYDRCKVISSGLQNA
ncbi:MAG: hypothetical protein ABI132_11245 [Rhodanobacteraceae bacterium]